MVYKKEGFDYMSTREDDAVLIGSKLILPKLESQVRYSNSQDEDIRRKAKLVQLFDIPEEMAANIVRSRVAVSWSRTHYDGDLNAYFMKCCVHAGVIHSAETALGCYYDLQELYALADAIEAICKDDSSELKHAYTIVDQLPKHI